VVASLAQSTALGCARDILIWTGLRSGGVKSGPSFRALVFVAGSVGKSAFSFSFGSYVGS
jgi:hypothetical protein